MKTHSAVTAFGALAQESRLAVFLRLVELGPDGAHPGELAHTLDIPAATLSFHLKTLLHAGLVDAEPAGRFIRYRANFAQVQELVDFLTRNCCGGNPAKCLPRSGMPRPAASSNRKASA